MMIIKIISIIIICVLSVFIGFSIQKYIQKKKNIKTTTILKLNKEIKELQQSKDNFCQEKKILEQELEFARKEKDIKIDSYNQILKAEKEKCEKLIDEIVNSRIQIADEIFDLKSEQISKDYQEAIEVYQLEYENVLAEAAKEYSKKFNEIISQIEEYNQQLNDISKTVSDYEKTQAAIIEQFKEDKKEQDKINFYCLQISSQDIEEIKKIKEILPFLRSKEPLMKVIWEVYYKKPFSDLTGRIIQNNRICCGIYKITNLKNNMSYIGQSVNIKERFRSHIKKGLGAEARSKNKLYTAMEQFGVENFSFEILQECSVEELNEKERYWISFFKANEFGYNETKGNS